MAPDTDGVGGPEQREQKTDSRSSRSLNSHWDRLRDKFESGIQETPPVGFYNLVVRDLLFAVAEEI
jgi:hypothetical protein